MDAMGIAILCASGKRLKTSYSAIVVVAGAGVGAVYQATAARAIYLWAGVRVSSVENLVCSSVPPPSPTPAHLDRRS